MGSWVDIFIDQQHKAVDRLTFGRLRCDARPVKRSRLPVKLMAAIWLTTYVVCVALVFSFILFEVLDIDSSDFPAPPTTAAVPIKLAEPAHEIKRAQLSGAALFWVHLAVVVVLVIDAAGLKRLGAPLLLALQPGPRGRRGLRIALPRASLADAAASA